jgi:hypothetical protein
MSTQGTGFGEKGQSQGVSVHTPGSNVGTSGAQTLLVPAAILHAPMDTRQEPGHYTGINLFRVNCTCGRRGVWYSSESNALAAHDRHVERAAEGGLR